MTPDAVTRLRAVALVPVLALEPWRVAPGRSRPDDWDRYWADCLAVVGLPPLTPVQPESYHVPVAGLTDPAVLDRLVRVVGDPESLAAHDGGPAALDGGVALVADGDVLAEPQCCVSLKDWTAWRDAAETAGADWAMLWIGHPWLSVRAAGDDLILSEPHEGAAPTPRWAVARPLVRRAAAGAAADLEAFAGRLAPVLRDRFGVPDPAPAARVMAGLGRTG